MGVTESRNAVLENGLGKSRATRPYGLGEFYTGET